jgi:predicted nucleic acid-binding protein
MLLRGNSNVRQKFDKIVEAEDSLAIPPFVHYEMQRGFHYRQAPAKEGAYRSLCARYPVGPMSVEALERAALLYADLRRAGRTVEDADILIAAFCLVNDHTLVTNNVKHFEGIEGLRLVNWAE